MDAEELLIQWGAWAAIHARAVGWTSADVMEPSAMRLPRDPGTHSDKVLAEILAREGSNGNERDSDLAVRQINPECRTVLVMRYVHGLVQRELADRLSITIRQVKHRHDRGKRLFMKHYVLRKAHRRVMRDAAEARRRCHVEPQQTASEVLPIAS